MSIVRDLPFTILSLEERLFITCSTSIGPGSTGTGYGSTANSALSCNAASGIAGRIIDRLGDLLGTENFLVACPATHLYATRGSTEADRKITMGVLLYHGDSSGGGDMAAYSTQSQPTSRVYFSTARTSDMAQWDTTGSTGALRISSPPAYYDLRGAKRFLRAYHIAEKNNVTTESSGDEQSRLSGTITFMGGSYLPMPVSKSYSSTSTST